MKSSIVFLLAGMIVAFSSCKKSYTCTCTGPIYATTSPAEVKTELGKKSKNDADAACALIALDINYTHCTIK